MLQTHLRFLQTTDLHMSMAMSSLESVSTDYGLLRMIPMIERLRQDGVPTCLFDTGDFLQGNQIADLLMHNAGSNDIHPLIKAFNALQYDAIALGNHEFDYGTDALLRVLERLKCPILASNIIHHHRCKGDDLAKFKQSAIITRKARGSDNKDYLLKVGVIGLLTPSTVFSNDGEFCKIPGCSDILSAAQEQSAQLHEAGADIIVALCHFGFNETSKNGEQVLDKLLKLPYLDAFFLGHEHGHYPSICPPKESANVNTSKPILMSGAYGSHLGSMELTLVSNEGRWRIGSHKTQLLACDQLPKETTPLQTQLNTVFARACSGVSALRHKKITSSPIRLHNYFTRVSTDQVSQITGHALSHRARRYLKNKQESLSELPVLSAVTAYQAGGHAGPNFYLDFSAGDITADQLRELYPYANKFALVKRNGKQIRRWLNHSSRQYNQITQGKMRQDLFNSRIAPYHSDILLGLTYEIDLSKSPDEERISQLQYNGCDVHNDDEFIVATNTYRLKGGGNYPLVAPCDIVYVSENNVYDELTAFFQDNSIPSCSQSKTWTFKPLDKTSVAFQSSAKAVPLVSGVNGRRITYLCIQEDGFASFELELM